MHGEATKKTEAMIRLNIRGKIPTTQEQVAISAVMISVVTGVAARAVISK